MGQCLSSTSAAAVAPPGGGTEETMRSTRARAVAPAKEPGSASADCGKGEGEQREAERAGAVAGTAGSGTVNKVENRNSDETFDFGGLLSTEVDKTARTSLASSFKGFSSQNMATGKSRQAVLERLSTKKFASQMTWSGQTKDDEPQKSDHEKRFMRAVLRAADGSDDESAQTAAGAEEDERVSKNDVKQMLSDMRIVVRAEIFDQMWSLFEHDKAGTVSLNEYAKRFCFMTCRESSTSEDTVELAYHLFDFNRNGEMNKQEFNAMLSVCIGQSLFCVQNVTHGRAAFRAFCEKEYCCELLDFVEELSALKVEHEDAAPSGVASALIAKYLVVNAEKEVNVSDDVRMQCRTAMEQCVGSHVDWACFDTAEKETLRMVEQGPLQRFRAKLRAGTDYIGNDTWASEGLSEEQSMDYRLFFKWAMGNVHLFSFFGHLKSAFEVAREARGGSAPPVKSQTCGSDFLSSTLGGAGLDGTGESAEDLFAEE